jgi:phage terminase large subunit-like protein
MLRCASARENQGQYDTATPIPLLKRLLADSGTVTSRSTTFDNRRNLAKPFR